MAQKKPKILLLDCETAPNLAYCWGLWDQTIGLNQIKSDWYIIAWAAKWLNDPPRKIHYMDLRDAKNFGSDKHIDKRILKPLWDLLDEADIIVTQNGKKFDQKKIQARFLMNDMRPPSNYRHIDIYQIGKKHFSFTSHKLEYLTDKLNAKYKKLKHNKFPGFELWKECLSGNQQAWQEMARYNKYDVLSLEELYHKVIPWDGSINFSVYSDEEENVCSCGSSVFKRNGFCYTSVGRYQRFKCQKCGAESKSKTNMLSMDKRKSMRTGTQR